MTTEEGVTKLRAGFLLIGHGLDPELISDQIGLKPTLMWRQGQPRVPRSPLVHDSDGWAIRTDYEVTLDLQSHVRRILALVHPHAQEIRRLCDAHGLSAELECVVRIIGDEVQKAPAITFDSGTVRQLADLQADLDIDINLISA